MSCDGITRGTFPSCPPGRALLKLWEAALRRGMPGLLLGASACFSALLVTADASPAEGLPSGFAPASLAGKRFTLDGINAEGASEDITLVLGDGNRFAAARSIAGGTAADDRGGYAYRRTGPYTGTLTTLSGHPGSQACSTHLTFTAATAGAYTVSCPHGAGSSGTFQLTVEAPFCLSLWDGLPCATVASLPQAYVGPLTASRATTEVVITNSDPNPAACEVALLFHRGTSAAPAVLFNGQPVDRNLFLMTVPREGAGIVALTAPPAQQLATGAVSVYARSPCTAGSLQVQGRYLLENPVTGDIAELFAIPSQTPRDWLGDGDCRVVTGLFGNGRNLGLAAVSTRPGRGAPAGTHLNLRSFDVSGNFSRHLPSIPLSGAQNTLWPWDLDQPGIIELCLEVPGASNFQAALIAIASKETTSKVQYNPAAFADAYRVGDATAWSGAAP